jgi:hypothetical protein
MSIAEKMAHPGAKSIWLKQLVHVVLDSKVGSNLVTNIVDMITDIDQLYAIAKHSFTVANPVWIYIVKRIMVYPEMAYAICSLICQR